MDSFHQDNARGKIGTRLVISKLKLRGWKVKELPDINTFGCDLLAISPSGKHHCIEVKSNSGIAKSGSHYDTFCLELTRDSAGTDLPDWRRSGSNVSILAVVDLSTSQVNLYNAKKLRLYADNLMQDSSRLIRAGVGIGQRHLKNLDEKLGAICTKVPWQCKEAGWCLSI